MAAPILPRLAARSSSVVISVTYANAVEGYGRTEHCQDQHEPASICITDASPDWRGKRLGQRIRGHRPGNDLGRSAETFGVEREQRQNNAEAHHADEDD